ncbi:MAG: RecX family transcriptional regulator [Solirubrobacterales bacterium]|nr:RecX family transcriptional regulator [Solirubrobacterales bacterium]
MRVWLAEREDDPELVEQTVRFLTENLALDDVRFSRVFADDKRDLAGWGARRIETTLRERGIAPELAREVASGPGESEVDRAVRVLAERGSQVDSDRERGRALGLLARKGYSAEDAYAAIRRLRNAA